MANSVSRGLKITGKILAQKKISDFPAYMIDALIEGEVVPRFRRIMPRDQVAAVDEVVKLLGAKTGPAISMETSQEVLGRGQAELTKIMAFLESQEEKELWPYAPERISVDNGRPNEEGQPKQPKEK